MTDAVRDAYDARAKEYADLNLGDLDRYPLDREWIGAFAKLASSSAGARVVLRLKLVRHAWSTL